MPTATAEDLLGGETSCQNQLDTAAYWAPALMRDGEPVTPSGSVAYYRPGAWGRSGRRRGRSRPD